MRSRAYFLLVIAVACLGLWWSWSRLPDPDYTLVVVLGLLCFLAEWYAIQIPSEGSASLSISIAYAAILLGGPLAAALASLSMAITRQDLRAKKPPLRMGFNAAQLVITALASGWLFIALGATPMLQAGARSDAVLAWLLPAIAVIPIQVGINICLVAIAMKLMHGVSFRSIWIEGFRPYLTALAAPFVLGLVFAQLVAVGGYWSIVLLVVPFLIAKQTFRVYQEHANAYRDTLRSLVSALEAKDEYTRGHSERVARFAKGIAEELGFSETAVQSVEWAALLHDIGKIAISTSTLRKPAALTEDEYKEVQNHPHLAAETLADIEFLEDILPMIRAHHERIDGRGYPCGLAGNEINVGARILAVADCFDAMTSDRSYRAALYPSEAAIELRRSSGTQLDPKCVAAFLRWAAREIDIDVAGLECA